MSEIESSIQRIWKLTANAAIKEQDPATAAKLWKSLFDMYAHAEDMLKGYRISAAQRYSENAKDAECLEPPPGLFQRSS